MHWSLRLILDLPKSILLFRKNHIKMTKLHKIEKKHGSIASFKAMILDPELSQAEMEIYVDLLPEIMENTEIYSTEEMEWFLAKGEDTYKTLLLEKWRMYLSFEIVLIFLRLVKAGDFTQST